MTIVEDRPVAYAEPAPLPPAGTSDASRWRLPARLARREVRRRPWRTLLVVLLIGVPVAGLVLGDIVYRTGRLSGDPAHLVGAGASTAWLYGGSGSTDLPALVVAAEPDLVRSGQIVVWQEATLPLRSTARPDEVAWVAVRTLDLTEPLTTGLVTIEAGRAPRTDDEVLLDATAAGRLGVGVGDRFTLVRPDRELTVVGLVEDSNGAMIAPGLDLSVARPEVVTTRLVLDDAATRQIAARVWPVNVQLSLARPSDDSPVDPVSLLFGWLFGVMLMAVLGVVVAAAFAVSGRRQLVSIGQLSASGADPAVIRRYLALQGTVAGAGAATIGAVLAIVTAYALGERMAHDGRLVVSVRDIVVLIATATVVATVAAIVPSRALVRSSVLSALGGRRPVAPVRRRQVPIGVALLGAGSIGLFVAVSAAAVDSGAQVGSMVLGTVAGLATLAGICCVCPVVVGLIARVGGRAGGSVRLATRSLGRHRARSAALLAAVVAITSAGVAVGAVVDREMARARSEQMFTGATLRTVEVMAYADSGDPRIVGDGSQPVRPPDGLRPSVEAIVGPARWVDSRIGLPREITASQTAFAPLVADPGVLEALGLDADERAQVARHDAALIDSYGDDGSTVRMTVFGAEEADVVVLRSRDGVGQRLVVSPEAADRNDMEFGVGPTFAILDHDVTRREYDDLASLSVAQSDAAYFRDAPGDGPTIDIRVGLPVHDWTTVARLSVMGALLLLVLAVVSIGMALWAAEGRDERDALVALGAPPGVLARSAALRAWFLATVGAVLGVPFGWWIISVVSSAAATSVAFPWVIAGGVVVAVPLIVASITLAGSAVGQRARRSQTAIAAAD